MSLQNIALSVAIFAHEVIHILLKVFLLSFFFFV